MNELQFTAHVKYLDHVAGILFNADPGLTVGEIRNGFKEKFLTDMPPLNNQYFGILRLIPLLFIRENLIKNKKSDEAQEICKNLTIIRHALAHNNIEANEDGYIFSSDKGIVKFSYEEIIDFCQQTERVFFGGKQ